MAEVQALLAEFATTEALLAAIPELRRQGFALDAFTPFPVEELSEALGQHDRRVPAAFLAGGIVGGAIGFGMQVLVNLQFPLWIGGRPVIAMPAFMMIAFELTVLGAVLAGIVTMLLANRLPRLNHPVFDARRFDLSAEDRFFLAVLAGPGFDRDAAGKALSRLDPVAITEVGQAAA